MIDIKNGSWLIKPEESFIADKEIRMTTKPKTDLWQRTYYGFRNANAPALMWDSSDNFTFCSLVEFRYEKQYDQCGMILYLDDENWFKASIEYENENYSRLGSVVTNLGYSDWATANIELPSKIYYRLSRRGPDFLMESSPDGRTFSQMRIFHIHKLNQTNYDRDGSNPKKTTNKKIRFGFYACSPMESSFTAKFTKIKYGECEWLPHTNV